jgi:hypothetical protein
MRLRLIFLIAAVLSFSGCSTGDTKCCEHVSTDSLSKGLYLERYRTFCAGVFGELTECYITDSIEFRQKIGSYDEHERFYAKLDGDKIQGCNLQPSLISDTIDKKTISKEELWKYHDSDKNCLATLPIFGNNTIKCDDDFYPASSYKTDDGYFITQVQYKCGNDYSNAVFFTDSSSFCIFIGVYIPGTFENNYSVRQNKASFVFYNVTNKTKVDTLKVQTYLLSDLKKGNLINVCK